MTPIKIKRLRRNLGLSQDAFAEAMGLTGEYRKDTVAKWERGARSPSDLALKQMQRLAESLN